MNRRALFLGLAMVAALAAPTLARERGDRTLDRILPEIRASHPGRLVDARLKTAPDGHAYYHIRWIGPDGVVLEFDVETS